MAVNTAKNIIKNLTKKLVKLQHYTYHLLSQSNIRRNINGTEVLCTGKLSQAEKRNTDSSYNSF